MLLQPYNKIQSVVIELGVVWVLDQLFVEEADAASSATPKPMRITRNTVTDGILTPRRNLQRRAAPANAVKERA